MRVRQHVNPLKSNFFDLAPEAVRVPPGLPLEVELGSAEAWFLMDRARHEPHAFYVGVEIRRELVDKANGDCARLGLGQVHNVFANISVDLPRLFRPRQVRRFFLNFPDPWFKTKQHKRRALSAPVVAQIAELLVPGGEFFVNTDIFAIALDAMTELELLAPGRFANLREPWRFLPAPVFAARSRRELACQDQGIKIWRLGYRRI